MPELPEVHTILEDLKSAHLIGRTIQSVHIQWPKTVGTPDIPTFCRLLTHQKILDLQRRGKYLIFCLSNQLFLFIHLRMTGRLLLVSADEPENPYIRLTLVLDHHQELRFHDTRKFGRWYLVKDPQIITAKMGFEPLLDEFSLPAFEQKIRSKKRALKPLLLDQSFIAGLGNIYVDEALWEAHLHPLRSAYTLNHREIQALHQAIITVLKRGIEYRGTTLGKGRTNYYRLDGSRGQHQTHLNVFRRTGQPCPRCGSPIIKQVIAQRSTHFCPYCQPF